MDIIDHLLRCAGDHRGTPEYGRNRAHVDCRGDDVSSVVGVREREGAPGDRHNTRTLPPSVTPLPKGSNHNSRMYLSPSHCFSLSLSLDCFVTHTLTHRHMLLTSLQIPSSLPISRQHSGLPLVPLEKDIRLWGFFMEKVKGKQKPKQKGSSDRSERVGEKGRQRKDKKTPTSKKGKGSKDSNGKEVPMQIKISNIPSARSPPHRNVSPPSPYLKTDSPSTHSPLIDTFVRRSPPATSKSKRGSRGPQMLPKSEYPEDVTPNSARGILNAQDAGNESARSIGDSSGSFKQRKDDSQSNTLEVPSVLGRSCDGVSPRHPQKEMKKSPVSFLNKFPSSFGRKSATEFDSVTKSSDGMRDPATSLLTDSSETHLVELSENLTAKSREPSAQILNDSSSYISIRHQSVPHSSSSDREEILIPRTSGSAPSHAYFHGTSKVDFVMCHLKVFEESEKSFLDDLNRLIQVHVLIGFIFENKFIFYFFSSKRLLKNARFLH
jgi:hypothetical protein